MTPYSRDVEEAMQTFFWLFRKERIEALKM